MKKTLFLLVAVMVILLLAPVAGQPTTTQVTNNLYADYDPQIAVDSLDNAYLVWYGYDGSDYEVFWAKIDPSGALTVAQVTNNTYNDLDPRMAVDPSGNTYIVWRGYDVNDYDIFWAKVDSSGNVTNTARVTNDDNNDSDPKMMIDSSGNTYLVWRGYDGNDYEIFWAKVDSSGALTGPVQVNINNTYDDFNLQMALDPSGNSYVVWQGYDVTDYEIFWAKVDPSGTVTNTAKVTDNSLSDYWPGIAVDPSGNSYVAWHGYVGSETDIFWAKVDSSGTVTNTVQVGGNEDEDSRALIAIDSSGNSYIIWQEYDGIDYEIIWAKVDPSGTVTNTAQVTDNIYSDYESQLAVDPSGNTYLVWRGYDGSDREIFWAKVDPSGAVTTAQVTDDEEDDFLPQIALDSSGSSYITWYGEDGDYEIFFLDVADALWSIELSPDTSRITTGDTVTFTVEGFDVMGASMGDVTGSASFLIEIGAGGSWNGSTYTSGMAGTWTIKAANGMSTDTATVTVHAPSNASPLIFKVLADTQLARASVMWECISGNLPEDISADIQGMIDAVQTHMANAASLSNPIYSNGELVKAIDIMKNISEELELNCWCD